jgi:hypothetical protein
MIEPRRAGVAIAAATGLAAFRAEVARIGKFAALRHAPLKWNELDFVDGGG